MGEALVAPFTLFGTRSSIRIATGAAAAAGLVPEMVARLRTG